MLLSFRRRMGAKSGNEFWDDDTLICDQAARHGRNVNLEIVLRENSPTKLREIK